MESENRRLRDFAEAAVAEALDAIEREEEGDTYEPRRRAATEKTGNSRFLLAARASRPSA